MALVAAAAAAFAAIYLRTLWRTTPATTREIAPATVALLAIASVLTLADRASWSLLFVLVATMAGLTLTQREAMVAIVASALLGSLTQTLWGDDGNAFAVGATTLGIGVMMIGFSRLIHANDELREAREELATLAVAEERLRFARDLHDLLGHSLSVITLKSELAGAAAAERDPSARGGRAGGDPASVRARRSPRCARRSSGYRGPTLGGELAARPLGARGGGHRLRARRRQTVALPAGRRGGARLGGARGHDERHPPQPAPATARSASAPTARAPRSRSTTTAGRPRPPSIGGSGLDGLRERAQRVARHARGRRRGRSGGFRLRVTVPLAEP